MVKEYFIKRVTENFSGDFEQFGLSLFSAYSATIDNFRPEGSCHYPVTNVKMIGCENGLIGEFEVDDQFVLCRNDEYNSLVCKDSCVELFIHPDRSKGYFNFEFNCCGTIHCSYIINPERTENGFKEFYKIPEDLGCKIIVDSSIKNIITNEIEEPIKWSLKFFIPFDIITNYVDQIDLTKTWYGNFYKCSDESSHPHWGSWNPVSELNFHAPADFGNFRFTK